MDIRVLNTDYIAVGILDTAESLLWIERYDDVGEFEIYTPVTQELIELLQIDYYLEKPDSRHTMIIETREIKSDPEQGDKFVVRGRDLESILDRRIVWTQTIVLTNMEQALKKVINDAFVDGVSDPNRIVPEFDFVVMNDSYITGIILNEQFDAQNILDLTVALCKRYHVGFELIINPEPTDGAWEFRLFRGKDRSYAQSTNSYVVFSADFDNLMNSNYFESKKNFKNFTLIIGDESGTTSLVRAVAQAPGGTTSGLNRREVLTDAAHLSRFIEGTSTPIDPGVYTSQISAEGFENMATNYHFVRSLDARVEIGRTFIYGEDFFLGDVVQVKDKYGILGTARIVEVTYSENLSGIDIYPTLDYS